jgi:RNA polymerase sigma factor (sigma-70 family)
MTGVVRVVIADDHPMFRYGLQAALGAIPTVEVVGTANNGEELLAVVEQRAPDVVITDLGMPKMNGTTATQHITTHHPEIGVLVLTMHEDDDAVFGAMRAGAGGYLLNGADRDEIARAVHAVAAGEAIYGSTIARRIMNFFAGDHQRTTAQAFPELTSREREVLDLVARGLGNHEIARRLVLSEKTVRNHLSNTLAKLQLHDRAAAVAKARDAGLGSVK